MATDYKSRQMPSRRIVKFTCARELTLRPFCGMLPAQVGPFTLHLGAQQPFGHLQGTSSAQVICKKAKLKFSSPGRTALRPFQGRWLVPMDPIWFH